jgi:phage terminase large subunit-like protein
VAVPADVLVGSETPRVFTPPLRKLTPKTSLGFACIEFAEDVLDLDLLPWQRWTLIHALELLPDGSLRFRTVLILVARQNGKSTLMQVLSLWVMYVLGRKLVIGTAQNLDVAEEVWQGAVEMAEEVDELAEEIEQVSKVNGKKFLKLATGERYKVAAASRRGGRGLSGDLVLLDELREHQSWDAWSAVTKTTMARAAAQVWAASNAGDAASIVLRWLRKIAHLAIGDPDGLGKLDDVTAEAEAEEDFGDESLAIFEWSAPPGCSVMDRDGWAQANPALGHTITERAILSAAKTDPEWVFRTEVLCQWIDTTTDGPFPPGAWEACGDPGSEIDDDSRVTFCVDVAWDRSAAYVAAAGYRADGTPQVEIVADGQGTEWVLGWFAAKESRMAAAVAVQTKSAPVASLVASMEEAGLEVVDWGGSALGAATGDLYDRVRAAVGEGTTGGRVVHLSQPLLDAAAANAATRPAGDAWLWDRKHSAVDIAPLVAVTGALWLLTTRSEPVLVTPGYYSASS